MTRLVAYLRSSTDNSEDSLPAQRAACGAFAEARGWDIVAVFEDAATSGALDVAARPGLSAAIVAIERGDADALVVHRLDRLARELFVSEAALSLVWKAGGRVFEAAGDGREVPTDDPTDPARTLIRQILACVASYERSMIRARLSAGMRRKSARGGWTGGTRIHPKYGFELVDGEYVPVPEQQLVIARIRELANGGMSYRAIARTLTAEGVPMPAGGPQWLDTTCRTLRRRAA
jgi:DNA invertase Pin-like site-specific DNA recombinase